MMVKRLMIASCVMFALMFLSSTPGYAQEPSIVGSWQITFYLEPNHVQGGTQCIEFTLNPNSVVGEPLEGQWSSTTFPNWKGDWFQEGEHFQFYGSTGGGLATQEYGDLASNDQGQGKYQHYTPLNPGSTTSSAGAFVLNRVQACAVPGPVPNTPPAPGTDPSRSSTASTASSTFTGKPVLESTLASLLFPLPAKASNDEPVLPNMTTDVPANLKFVDTWSIVGFE